MIPGVSGEWRTPLQTLLVTIPLRSRNLRWVKRLLC
jgi:hypothetical protein